MRRIPLTVAVSLLAAAESVAPANADPVIYPPNYGSNGAYAVGGHDVEGLTASIPPGHYRVGQAPGMFQAPGFWLRCSGVPCAPTHPENIIGNGGLPDSTLMEILPSDTAVYLFNTTLAFLG